MLWLYPADLCTHPPVLAGHPVSASHTSPSLITSRLAPSPRACTWSFSNTWRLFPIPQKQATSSGAEADSLGAQSKAITCSSPKPCREIILLGPCYSLSLWLRLIVKSNQVKFLTQFESLESRQVRSWKFIKRGLWWSYSLNASISNASKVTFSQTFSLGMHSCFLLHNLLKNHCRPLYLH